MSQKVVLLDLEKNTPTLKLLRDIVQHYSTLYLFNCTGKFEFALDDLTELASLISSGRIIILDIPEAEQKEYEYAVLVGQLMALLEEGATVELISAMDSSEMLAQMLEASNIPCGLIQVLPEGETQSNSSKHELPSIDTIQAKPYLQLVKKYCDALAKMTGKPTTVDGLKNSISNILQLVPEKTQKLVGMLINLHIVKRYDDQISFHKKILKQWIQLDIHQNESTPMKALDHVISDLTQQHADQQETLNMDQAELNTVQQAQQSLFKNFGSIDPKQIGRAHV